jgi:hypothetical protein
VRWLVPFFLIPPKTPIFFLILRNLKEKVKPLGRWNQV